MSSTSIPAESTSIKKVRRKKKDRYKSRMITGYIIYASEIRKEVIKKYPDRDFGYISKLVGLEWKNLPQETKIAFEKRAQEQNAKNKLRGLLPEQNGSANVSNHSQNTTINNNNNQSSLSIDISSATLTTSTPLQSMRTNIVYKKPTTVRLRPKDASTQTEPVKWIESTSKKPLKFSQSFLEYLENHHHHIIK